MPHHVQSRGDINIRLSIREGSEFLIGQIIEKEAAPFWMIGDGLHPYLILLCWSRAAYAMFLRNSGVPS